jgi:hypothetical protein
MFAVKLFTRRPCCPQQALGPAQGEPVALPLPEQGLCAQRSRRPLCLQQRRRALPRLGLQPQQRLVSDPAATALEGDANGFGAAVPAGPKPLAFAKAEFLEERKPLV